MARDSLARREPDGWLRGLRPCSDAATTGDGHAYKRVGDDSRTRGQALLFTHRGLSGPAILQISSYWNEGDFITLNLSPDVNLLNYFKAEHNSNVELVTVLTDIYPKRFAQQWCKHFGSPKRMSHYTLSELASAATLLHHWQLAPERTEGYAKAEVTCGGIDTNELSSKTMEAKKTAGLFFIGEVVDVTGQLGGYNFQWAWASGFAAGQYV